MPELPEVETIRRQLARKIIGKKLNGLPAGRQGWKIIGVRRRAKLLIIDFVGGQNLIFHLKLTGQLIFNGKPSAHTRKVFNFGDGSRLIFNDARKFGWWKKTKGTEKIEDKFGPEALEISLDDFKRDLSRKPNAKIKPLLMDQKFIAGIGNIYSDEILFAARVNPLRRVKSLEVKEVGRIHQSIKKILVEAIKCGGSSVEYYLDACGKKGDYVKYHKVYQREGKKCFRCGASIERLKISGRSARFCPKCQPFGTAQGKK
ncbi:MAG: DNA-formamidopyrimidine glycosylase [bacterium]